MHTLNLYRLAISAISLAACQPKEDGASGGDDTHAETSATTGPGAETGSDTGAGTETAAAETESSGGSPPEEIPEECVLGFDPYAILNYASAGGIEHETCTLVAAELDMEGDLELELMCAEPRNVSISHGPLPDLSSLVGQEIEVDGGFVWGDVTQHDLDWLILRHAGTLVYAGVVGNALAPEGSGPDLFAPLALEAVFGLCELQDVEDPNAAGVGGDGYWCAQAARMQLEVGVAGEAPQVLAAGQTADIAVEGGSYRVEVAGMFRGVDCWPGYPPGMHDTYGFVIVRQPG